MLETFTALAFAHVLADFIFQTRWMVDNKAGVGLAVHIVLVGILAAVVAGSVAWPILLLTALHLAIDAVKTFALPNTLMSFCADQALHIASILAVAWIAPGLWADGLWSASLEAPWNFALATGLIIAVRAGHFAMLHLAQDRGVVLPAKDRHHLLGAVERGVLFALVAFNLVIFAVAAALAAGFLRLNTGAANGLSRSDTRVLVLASIAWALAVGAATSAWLALI